MPEVRQMYVDGRWVEASGGDRFDVVEPATAEVVAAVPLAGEADVDAAVAAARRAFDEGPWGTRVDERERGRVLLRLAELIRSHRERLAELEVRDCGKPLAEARLDVDEAAFTFEYYAGWTTKMAGDVPPIGRGAMSLVVKEPVGVCALIVPWNYPLLLAAWKIAPALAAGCTAILKPAEQTPLSALELAGLAEEAGVPPGVLSVLTGDGTTGAALVRHRAVDKVSFTGSRDVGVEVMRSAAATLKRVTLELGGKSPNIVFADAPFEQAMAGTAAGIFGNQGEICSAGSRVLVERSIYDDALQALVDAGAGLRLGHGLDPATTMGPLVSRAQQERVQRYVELGEREGAKVALRGEAPGNGGLERGFFVAPTIFYDVGDDMRIAQEEIFGPVMAVIPYAGEEELARLANGTEYGLAAAIWTRDVTRALRTARAVRAGTVWINDAQISPPESLWGGFKQSGIGRELGPYGLEAYLESKQIYINLETESAGQRAS